MITEDDLKRGKQQIEDLIQKFNTKADELSAKRKEK